MATFSLPDSLAPLGRFDELDDRFEILRGVRVRPGFFHRAPLAVRIPHLHDRRGRIDPCRPANLFRLDLELDGTVTTLGLPRLPSLQLFAAALSTAPLRFADPMAHIFSGEREEE